MHARGRRFTCSHRTVLLRPAGRKYRGMDIDSGVALLLGFALLVLAGGVFAILAVDNYKRIARSKRPEHTNVADWLK